MHHRGIGNLRQQLLFEHKITYLLLIAVIIGFTSLIITRESPRPPLPQPTEPLIGPKVPFSADLRMINDPRSERFVAPTALPDQIIPLNEPEAIITPLVVEIPSNSTTAPTPLLPLRPITSQTIPAISQSLDAVITPLPELAENIVEDTLDLVPETVEQLRPVLDTVLPNDSLLPTVSLNVELDLGL